MIRTLVIAAIVLHAASAFAFPQLTIRGGVTQCTSCHVSPAGGGLLTDYGRMEAGDTLSAGGDGRALHGAIDLPDWLLLGGDLRGAALAYDDRGATEGVEYAAFPMQADLRAGVHAGPLTIAATGGVRGSTRLYDRGNASYLISTEHYAMLGSDTLYVRAGRFFPIQGLRLPDHTLYVRRYTGTGLYEEPYAVAAGYTTAGWELHATGFVHDPVLDVGRREAGGVLHGELHGDAGAVALSARVGDGDEGTRAIGGLSGRLAAGPAVVLAEVDAIHDTLASGAAVTSLAGLAGADLRIARGVQLFGWYEHYEESLAVRQTFHHGGGLAVELYPRAHWEILVEGLVQRIGTTTTTGMGMVQVHYYL